LKRYQALGSVFPVCSANRPQIAGDIATEAKKLKSNPNAVLPKKGSDVVNRWQTGFNAAFETVTRFNTQAKSIPFNTASQVRSRVIVFYK
jgi:hypothetical protein